MNIVLTVVAIGASVLGAGMAFPQAVRLFKTRCADGVSATWIGVSLAINAWWAAYAMAVSLWALLPVCLVSFIVYSWIAVVYVDVIGQARIRAIFGGAVGLGLVPLPVLLIAGWEVAGVAVGLCYGLQLAPAVVASMRTRDLAGVSAATWILSFVEGVLWLAYGFGVADWALIAGGVSGIVMAGTILGRLVATDSEPFAVRSRRALTLV
jgi:uncharacterized protein with PQ loop repeat